MYKLVQCMYGACKVLVQCFVQCMYGACTVKITQLFGACVVLVQCIMIKIILKKNNKPVKPTVPKSNRSGLVQ